ncbi:MAG TPA: cell division FtsA domain-containing protein [Candidatus Paceibacterota bacterium]
MREVYTGIDIGTYHVKVVICAPAENPESPMHIIGTGTASSKGMRHGYIVDVNEAKKSIREAMDRAQAAAKIRVRSARVGIGGIGLDEIKSSGSTSLTAFGGIVTDQSIDRAKRESEKMASSKLVNRNIIHTIPLEHKIDSLPVLGQPHGLQGTKLTVDTLIITMLAQHHDDMLEAVEGAGVEVEGVMASPLAASLVTLNKSQKMAGVVLANIGSETLSVVVFDNDIPISVKVFPMGAADVTNTIALSFQVPLHEAEQLKRGAVSGSDVPQRKMDALITKKLKEMFTLVNGHLKMVGRQKLLPAGIVITGGGSGLTSAAEIARSVLQLPSQTSQIGLLSRASSVDATWAVAAGLCRWAYAEERAGRTSSLGEIFSDGWQSIKRGIRSLLP